MSRWVALALLTLVVPTRLARATPEPTPVGKTSNDTATPAPAPDGGEGDGLGETIREALTDVILTPFEWVSEGAAGVMAALFADYPDVRQPWVQEFHAMVFTVALVLAVAAIVWIGITHMLNQTDGVRTAVYVLMAVGFGAIAPDLLWYPVELSAQTTEALLPADPEFRTSIQFTLQMAVIAILDVVIVLGILLLFLARNVYILLGVGLAPLIALMAITPGLTRYGRMLAQIWVGFLLIGPLNAGLLSLILQMIEANGFIPEWLWALAGTTMLLGLPLTVLSAGAVLVGPGLSLMRSAPNTIRRQYDRFKSGSNGRQGQPPGTGPRRGGRPPSTGPRRGGPSQGGRRSGEDSRPDRDRSDRDDSDNRFEWRDRR
ncbi:hypothetical protein [Salinilacihabitans rarus]|uniref:hypothetical protein n=1 Tax=Salinilacihabitans rarus TaxID=2961596 RepID=UPI0020C8AA21|nr:hypothetical protein [Salinilacihabitans rarus]